MNVVGPEPPKYRIPDPRTPTVSRPSTPHHRRPLRRRHDRRPRPQYRHRPGRESPSPTTRCSQSGVSAPCEFTTAGPLPKPHHRTTPPAAVTIVTFPAAGREHVPRPRLPPAASPPQVLNNVLLPLPPQHRAPRRVPHQHVRPSAPPAARSLTTPTAACPPPTRLEPHPQPTPPSTPKPAPPCRSTGSPTRCPYPGYSPPAPPPQAARAPPASVTPASGRRHRRHRPRHRIRRPIRPDRPGAQIAIDPHHRRPRRRNDRDQRPPAFAFTAVNARNG